MSCTASILPSAKELLEEALQKNQNADVNTLHYETFKRMLYYRDKHYKNRVDEFLSKLDISDEDKEKIRKEMLKPVVANDVEYSNIMEEASRRVSQTFQVISGNLAELCAERELIKVGLKHKVHYEKKKERTDFIIYYPDIANEKKRHRIEVKNVKLRERGTRGLVFDGDSMFGFFNESSEFTSGNVDIIEKHCQKTIGYCYIPPSTLKNISFQSTFTGGAKSRFKSNTSFGTDMANFVKTGTI